jgi:hypothetical protein
MFYCEDCRVKNDWPTSMVTSHGACELCGKGASCWDRPSSSLPPLKPVPELSDDDALIVAGKTKNAERAGWAENAVNTFARETYGRRTFTRTVIEQPGDGGDAYTMVQDLIGDLLHLAVRHDWDPTEMLGRAQRNFEHENRPDYMGD